LRASVEAALSWIDNYGDGDGDGYIEYQSNSKRGLVNQGWKDSGDGIVDERGRTAQPPIALVEVQGYVYRAKLGIAELFERAGDAARARDLRQQARTLRRQFNRDFWVARLGIFALCLERRKRRAAVVASNAGQALWCGIADVAKARSTAKRLLQPDMFSGWGIRTLSSDDRSYNPVGYHLGTVWPHDNAIIAAGLRRYGLDDAALRVFEGILEAATKFTDERLPEVFAGFDRAAYDVPVHYPVACHPQAWAAASIPYLLQSTLGIVPDGFAGRLRVMRPVLPDPVHCVEIRGIPIGDGVVDLEFRRERGRVRARALRQENATVSIEPHGALD
jgi:glycogen debranching enzyme